MSIALTHDGAWLCTRAALSPVGRAVSAFPGVLFEVAKPNGPRGCEGGFVNCLDVYVHDVTALR